MTNKRNDHVSNIILKCHDIFTENFTIFFFFFKTQEKLETCRNDINAAFVS